MVKFIESELVLLKKEIDEMWTLVYNQLDRAGEAVLTLDKELAQQVIVRERRVNAFELKIDSDVEDVIALYNPVAIDLRFVLAMLKINTNNAIPVSIPLFSGLSADQQASRQILELRCLNPFVFRAFC